MKMIKDHRGNIFKIIERDRLGVLIEAVEIVEPVIAMAVPYGEYWFENPGDKWWCADMSIDTFKVYAGDPFANVLSVPEAKEV